jgi:hypothetical protein
MQQVRDAYTQGGGSLGYVPYAPRTIDEFRQNYESALTGGSKQAYEFLTGRPSFIPVTYNSKAGNSLTSRRMASGGIAALAEGGGLKLPENWGVAGGEYDDASEKIKYFNQNNITPEQLLAANQNVSQADIDWMLKNGYAGTTIAPGSNKYVQNIRNYFTDNPNVTYAEIQKAAQGLDPADVKAAMAKAGLSGAAQFAAFNQNIGDTRNVDETYSGLKGLSSNINYWISTHPGASLNDFQNEIKKWDLNEDDIKRATGKTAAELFTGPITQVANPAEGASGGGNTVVNSNGTITTTPNIPGRPEGGFTGVGQVRDAYTQGGGSLGYVPYAPRTIDEFNTKYGDRLTGGSKQSYDFLTGKTSYSPVPYTPTGEIQKPYAESVLGMPADVSSKMYLFDPSTRQYKINPDYAIPTRDDKGKVSYNMTNKDVAAYVATSPSDDAFLAWATSNNLSAEQIAAATGMPISEVYKRLKKGKPAEGAGGSNTGGSNTGGSNTGGSNTGGSGDGRSIPGLIGYAAGGLAAMARGGMSSQYNLGGYSDGGRLLRGPGDGVSDSIPATIGNKQPARLADGEFVVPARIVSELGNGSTEAGARKLYAMMERVQTARRGTVGKSKVAKNSRADKYLPA